MKLTNSMRESIHETALTRTFRDRLLAQEKRIIQHAVAYMSEMGLRNINTVPEDLQEYVHCFEKVRFYCSGPDIFVEIPPNFLTNSGTTYQIGGSSCPCDDIPVIKQNILLMEERAQFSKDIYKLLDSVSTLNKLAEISPALSALCPVEENIGVLIPKEFIDSINRRLSN